MSKKYFVHYGQAANVYSLRWVDNTEDETLLREHGYEQITRKEAIALAMKERKHRKEDPSFSGYAEDHIFPVWNGDEAMRWSMYHRSNDIIVERDWE